MKKIFTFLIAISSLAASAQNVGINTNSPTTTLQVVGNPTSTTLADGVTIPNLTGDQLKAKDALYTSGQIGTVVYVSSAVGSSSAKTINVISAGFYCFNGTVWVSPAATTSVIGDVKTGLQSGDHSGWIKLDGRAISGLGLSASQQAAASSLGITGNLPNASNAVPLQNGTTLGSVSGSMSTTIVQSQLPNVTIGGNTNSAGSHKHDIRHVPQEVGGFPQGTNAVASFKHSGESAKTNNYINETDFATTDRITDGVYRATDLLQATGSHTHTITTNSINGGVTQQALNITPRSLSVNIFIYLGQ